MSSTIARTRFAPSPTGWLHIGNARTALFGWLFARHHNGKFVLRIEDTDTARSTKAFEDSVLEDLRWLGIDWDEGPDKGGDFGPYRQSERFGLYREYADKLLKQGKAYPCYCTHERLEELRKKQEKAGWAPKYDGRCRTLSEAERPSGIKPVIRFFTPERQVVFEDKVHKKVSFDARGFGDFIIIGSDGVATYNFAVVIDDALMNITHVIRGDDHLSNTPRQILLFEAFGFHVPQYAHTPLILGHDRTPLSKRHGAASVKDLREAGFLPEAIVNHLCHLGFSPGKEFLLQSEAIEMFSLERLSKSPAIFDMEKLKMFNRRYIENTDTEKLASLAQPYLPDSMRGSPLHDAIDAAKSEAVTLKDIPDILLPFFEEPRFDEEAKKALSESYVVSVLKSLSEEVEKSENLNAAEYKEIMARVKRKTGESGKRLFMPIRTALTGRLHGLEIEKVFALMGKKKILERLKKYTA